MSENSTDDQIALCWDYSSEAVSLRLRAVVRMLGYSISDLGRELDETHRVTVQSWLKGKSAPKRPALAMLRKKFGITTDFVLLGDWRNLRAEIWSDLRAALISEKAK
jgi:hypothetical protein